MNEREIFEKAIEIQNPAQRQAFLDQACGGDATLRAQLDQLLDSHKQASQFLNVPLVDQLSRPAKEPVQPTIELSSSGVVAVGRPMNAPHPDNEDDESHPGADLSFLQPSTKPGSLGRLGHYEILQVLGQGAFGIVFKAFDEKLHRHVAIKAMSPQLASTSPPRKRFLREARSVAALKHENIVQIYSVEEQPLPYLAMEFVDGQTLQQKLNGSGPLETAEILHLGRQMAAGLSTAHDKGLIHRDIKPGNILIEAGAEQKVKITDFGLARAADDATMTRTGTIAGTPMYMAPEQALGLTLDQRADLFSLGSVLYQMTCGRPPFRGANALAVLKRVIDETPRPIQDILPQVPDWLCALIEKLHAKNPEERYQTAKEVADVLARCQNELQVNGKVTSMPARLKGSAVFAQPAAAASTALSAQPSPASASSRRPLVAIVASAILLMVGLAGAELTEITQLFRHSGDKSLSIANRGSEAESSATTPKSDPDRRAAEWVLSKGGRLQITPGGNITSVNELPTAEFSVTLVSLSAKVSDDELAMLSDLQHLNYLYLGQSTVTNAGLARISNCPHLLVLALDSTQVSDAGLAALKSFTQLKQLSLHNTRVTDAGLIHVHQCDALTDLDVSLTQLTDDGLNSLSSLKNLTFLQVYQTRVSPEGAREFASANPHCKIRGDGGLIHPQPKDRFTNSLGMEFALVPKGKAWLGGGGGHPGDRLVEFKEDCYLGIYEVTQEEWEQVTGKNPSVFWNVEGVDAEDLKRFPVDNVSWDDAQRFLKRLNEMTNESEWIYRLPTDAEWEYACRGGPINRVDSTFDFYIERPAVQLFPAHANYEEAGIKRTSKVGSYAPNRLGLYDMHGNVWELCNDVLEGKGVVTQLMRGGCWALDSNFCRASNNYGTGAGSKNNTHGLRVARSPKPDGQSVEPRPAIVPFDAAQAKAHQEAWAKHLGVPVEFTNSIGMKFRLVPPGVFTMEMTKEEAEAVAAHNPNNETWWKAMLQSSAPEHRVRLTQAYYAGTYEVTQEQYEKVMGTNPSTFSASGGAKDKVAGANTKQHPVEMVSFIDAAEFCIKLSKQEQLKPVYSNANGAITLIPGDGYRLPTEAEWEFACRAGTTSPFSFPFDYGTLGQYGWFGYIDRTHAVGERKPNPFGLCDMHGNVHEWCFDWAAPYDGDSLRDPTGPSTGIDRICRGGAYNYLPPWARSAWRGANRPSARLPNTGLRVARFVAERASKASHTEQ